MKKGLLLALAVVFWPNPGFATDGPKTPSRTLEGHHTACYGTAVSFVSTLVEAAKLARKEHKLVMVLHVSGHFEDPNLT